METFSEVLRLVLTLAFVAGFIWTLSVLFRYYQFAERPTRLLRMMRRLGLNTASLRDWRLQYYVPTAARFCQHCASKAECDAWLATHERALTPPAFCSNAGFFGTVAFYGPYENAATRAQKSVA